MRRHASFAVGGDQGFVGGGGEGPPGGKGEPPSSPDAEGEEGEAEEAEEEDADADAASLPSFDARTRAGRRERREGSAGGEKTRGRASARGVAARAKRRTARGGTTPADIDTARIARGEECRARTSPAGRQFR
jgi:hypothetical protein